MGQGEQLEEVEEVKHESHFLDRISERHLHLENLFHGIWEDHCKIQTSTKREKIQVMLIRILDVTPK